MNVIVKILSWILNIFLLGIIILVLSSYISNPFLIKLYGVASQSMYPTLKKGDLIIVQHQKNYKKGDVITFKNPKGTRQSDTVTHRILNIKKEREHTIYKTKGDANNNEDGWNVREPDILGLLKFNIPYAGYAVSISHTPQGFIALVIVPAFIIIYEEIQNLRKEGLRLFAKKNRENHTV